jgi:protein ImuB
VAVCCATAAAQGIRPEMPLAEVKSLVRELMIERHEPQTDCQALKKLAEACEKFSPCVALEEAEEPESLLLDISNLAHLLGSDARLAGRVERFFTNRKYRVQIAVADTIGLAWAVAHFMPVLQPPLRSPAIVPGELASASEFSTLDSRLSTITQLPVESLRIARDTADLLRQLGIETVGQLLPLPRESLTSRFGDQLLRRLDQLTGAAAEVLVPHHGLAALKAGCALEQPTADRAMLVHILSQLTEQLTTHLAARDQGAVLLVCVLKSAGGPSTSLRIGLVEPSASVRQMMELIQLHLETITLADEVAQVAIHAAVVGRLGSRQHELFVDGWPSDPHQLAVLVNRLSSRLGDAQVLRPQLRASPLPERAFRYVPATERKSRDKSRESRARNPALDPRPSALDAARPLLLYPEPRVVRVICVAPDGPPQLVWLDDRLERIVQHWGPERIETLWWHGPSVRRDYYRIAVESGEHWWIFRQLADGCWFLHGIFA